MRNNWTILLSLSLAFCSCREAAQNSSVQNAEAADLALLQTCIDSTLQLDSGLNTARYSIDFGSIKTSYRKAIDSFLKINPTVIETDLDSLLTHDSTWTRYQFFQDPVIRFDTIIRQKDGTILINTSKIKASDGAIRTEIILQPKGTRFLCLKSEITTIS